MLVSLKRGLWMLVYLDDHFIASKFHQRLRFMVVSPGGLFAMFQHSQISSDQAAECLDAPG